MAKVEKLRVIPTHNKLVRLYELPVLEDGEQEELIRVIESAPGVCLAKPVENSLLRVVLDLHPRTMWNDSGRSVQYAITCYAQGEVEFVPTDQAS